MSDSLTLGGMNAKMLTMCQISEKEKFLINAEFNKMNQVREVLNQNILE